MKREKALREQVNRLARQGATISKIARVVGLDHRQVRVLLRESEARGGRADGA